MSGATGLDPTGLIPPGLDTTLVLVRHAESTWLAQRRFQGRRNPWLSALGRSQAAAVAGRLADPHVPPALPIPPGPPLAIWHSPLKRARDTATPIAERLAAPLVEDPRLTEIGQGAWETRTHRAIRADSGELLDAWLRDPVANVAPGGETLDAVRTRVEGSLRDILSALAAASPAATSGAARSPWGVVVSHEGILRVAALLLLGRPLSEFWSYPFELAALSVAAIEGDRASFVARNLASHLDGLEGRAADRGGAL